MNGFVVRLLLLAATMVVAALASCAIPMTTQRADVVSVLLPAVEDSQVTTDSAQEADPQGLRDNNSGSLEFIAVSYANKVQKDEQLVSLGLVKFGLTPVKGRAVQSATLQLFAIRADLTQTARLVDVSLVEGDWTEKEVTFNKRPSWSSNSVATVAAYGGGTWYSWDVTPTVIRSKTDNVSYVLGLRVAEEKKWEQVLFATHETGQATAPRLIVTYIDEPIMIPWYAGLAAVIGGMAVGALLYVGGLKWTHRRRQALES